MPKKNKKKDKGEEKGKEKEDGKLKEEEHVEPVQEDLKILLDNFGHSISEPVVSNRDQDNESSLVEVSVRKVIYKEKNPETQVSKDITTSSCLLADCTTYDITDFSRSFESNIISDASECFCECRNIFHPIDNLCNNLKSEHEPYPQPFLTQEGKRNCSCQKFIQEDVQNRRVQINECGDGNHYRDVASGLDNERIDRYSLNHIHYSRLQPLTRKYKRWNPFSFWSKGSKSRSKDKIKQRPRNSTEREPSTVSGLTIPQLYKANVSNTVGYTPGKFTFRAVTGYPHLFEVTEKNYKKDYDKMYSEMSLNGIIPSQQYDVRYQNNRDSLPNRNDEDKSKLKEHTLKKEDNYKENNLRKKNDCTGKNYGYVITRPPPERIDIYCFDHLNTGYFRTSDHPPPLISDLAMERLDAQATRFWAEIFGFVHLFTTFIIAFFLQLFKFILYGLIRPLMVGFVQLTSDYFIKPLLTVTYNGLTQPVSIFLYNVISSLRDLCQPIARSLGYFLGEIAVVLRAIRLVEYKHYYAKRKDQTQNI